MLDIDALPDEFVARAKRLLNLRDFDSASAPVMVGSSRAVAPSDQHVLRMMLRSDDLPFSIPPELDWLADYVEELDRFQVANGLHNPFVYVTVRQGPSRTTTDDLWHVDGFSMRTPHAPEQNYVRVVGRATEFLVRAWDLPETFDPLVHNIHRYFQQHEAGELVVGEDSGIYAIDPYCVHRRPPVSAGEWRSFTRVSFVPIEIEDDTCTRNPLFPAKAYGRSDVRRTLVDWSGERSSTVPG